MIRTRRVLLSTAIGSHLAGFPLSAYFRPLRLIFWISLRGGLGET